MRAVNNIYFGLHLSHLNNMYVQTAYCVSIMFLHVQLSSDSDFLLIKTEDRCCFTGGDTHVLSWWKLCLRTFLNNRNTLFVCRSPILAINTGIGQTSSLICITCAFIGGRSVWTESERSFNTNIAFQSEHLISIEQCHLNWVAQNKCVSVNKLWTQNVG